MKRSLAFFLALAPCAPLFAGDPGTTAANFLKLGIGPRAVAMGEAQAGLADDVYASYWNPAGLAQLSQQQIGFVHTRYIEDITAQYVAYAYPHARWGTFAGHFTHLGIGKFDAYDAAGQPAGKVGAGDSAPGVSYAYALLKDKRLESRLSAGLTLRAIQEKLDTVTATAFAADLGIHYAPGRRWGPWTRGLKAGAVIRNLGTPMKFDRESFPLPRSFTGGLAWSGDVLGESLTLAVDGTQPNDGAAVFGGGLELWTLKTLALRGGYTSKGDLGNGWRVGAGLKFKTIQVDYAFGGMGDFGDTHRIGLTLAFSKPAVNKEAEAQDWYEKGRHNFDKGRYTEAIVQFNKALELDPAHPQALERMNKTYERLRNENPE